MSDPTDGLRRDDPTDEIRGVGRDPLDHLAEEFAERCRRGEAPTIAEYEARYPSEAERVRKILGAVSMMEGLRRGSRLARAMPERLGDFRILRELGRGGMGVVYEAVQESLDRHVAVKVIHHVHLDPKRLRRFQHEAQAVAQLHHTNIVPIFGVGEHDGLPYYAMQMIRGGGLDDLLAGWRRGDSPRGPDRWRFAAHVGVQAAEALQYAHEQGVLHRDIKPANLLIDEHEIVWITDFGLAKLAGREELTASGDVIGTLRYLAPEALHGGSDARSDVYSLGLTLYELLTLEPPFGELSPSELLRRVSEGRPTTPRRLEPMIPADLETIVLKASAPEPAHRYASAGEMAADLRRFLEDRPILARRANLAERAWRWSRRNRTLAALVATAAASLVLAAVVGWVGYARAEEKRKEAEAATRRAEANVKLSLAVFGELFDRLAPSSNLSSPPMRFLARRMVPLGPGGPMDRGPGVGLGRGPGPGAMHHGGMHLMPMGRGGFGGGPGGPGGPGDGPIGPPPDEEIGPDGPPSLGMTSNTDLLASVLSFYERFAAQNATDPHLQGEAARAYRRVATLYRSMGRDDEAEAALARSISMLEALATRYPADRSYRLMLVEVLLPPEAWTDDAEALGRNEAKLRHARALAEELVAESPDDLERGRLFLKTLGELGATLHETGQLEEAEACYRQAIDRANELAEHAESPLPIRLSRVTVGEALTVLLDERGRRDEALAELNAIAAEIRKMASDTTFAPAVAGRAATISRLYQSLGDDEQADAMSNLVDGLDRFGPGFGPHGRSGMGRGPRGGPR